MIHYFGAKAIVQRLGLKDHRRLPWLIKKWGVPAFLRREPGHPGLRYYASESMLAAWELVKAKQCYEELTAKQNGRL